MLNCPFVEAKREELVHAAGERTGWIFELDGRGTVLHSRALPGTSSDSAMAETYGFNFFDDLDGFD